MKRLSTLFLLLCCSLPLMATPARRGFFQYTQPDGSTILLQRHGDEWGHWTTNESGQVVREDADGYYRVAEDLDAETAAQVAAIRRAARRSVREQEKALTHVAVGQKRFLVILVAFKDKAFTISDPQETVTSQLNDSGYSGNGATGSARDFYYDSSNGYFEPIFDVYGPVTLDNNMAYYGGNDSQGYDKNAEGAVKEGCQLLDDEINFADYDNDNDGKVDMVYMLYAGYGEADGGPANSIWPHQYNLSYVGINLRLDGKQVDKYACSNELCSYGALKNKLDGIGSVCHEFGHAMGLPDFYDSDYTTNGEARGLADFSTMCEGCYNNESRTPPYFNTEERILLGWADESEIKEFPKSGQYALEAFCPEQEKTEAYKIPTEMEGEYFLLECRAKQGWDAGLSGEGLVIYHVDKSSRKVSISGYGRIAASKLWSDWESYNAINENGKHPCFYVVPAVNQKNYNYSGNGSKMTFPGSSKITYFNPVSWDKVDVEITLSEIAFSGAESTFKVSGVASSALAYHVIDNPGNGVYSVGGSFALQLIEAEDRPYTSVKWYVDGSETSASSVTLTAGSHVVEAEVSLTDGRKDRITLEITAK